MAKQTLKCSKRDCQLHRRYLREISDGLLVFIDQLDREMKTCTDKDLGSKVAKIANALEKANERIRFFALNDSFREEHEEAVAKARKRLAKHKANT